MFFNLQTLQNSLIFPQNDIFILSNFLSKNLVLQLAEQYPTLGFQQHITQNHNADISNIELEYINCGSVKQISEQTLLQPIWQHFFAELFQSDYLNQLSDLTNINLRNKFCRLEFIRFKPAFLIDAHYDKEPHKVLTHVFYLNPVWKNAWGGLFHLLNPDNNQETIFQIPPINCFSVLIKASTKAWHKVEVLRDNALTRITFQLEFYDVANQ
jgi:hypothetical protein